MRRVLLCLPLVALAAACGSDKGTGPKQITPPAADSISPRTGTVGTEVRIYGRSFAADSVAVFFNALKSPRAQVQNGSVFAVAPEGLQTGAVYDIRVVNRDGGADTLAAAFQAVAPTVLRVNGVAKPSGLVGMTVLLEGSAFGDAAHGKVYFTGSGGAPIQAAIADSANDWTNSFVVTSVPTGTADVSDVWVETANGVSTKVPFTLISASTFSPSVINWTRTTDLPQALQGLGAAFVPPANGTVSTSYVFAVGGAADSTNVATTAVSRAAVEQTGALGAWSTGVTQLPSPRAYLSLVAATAQTASLDTATVAAYLYAIGGVDESGATVSSVLYAKVAPDGSIGAWQTTTALPTPLHSAAAVVFRGYVYLIGGADQANVASTGVYRALVHLDGTLGSWEALPTLPEKTAFASLINFGPYFYAVGGDSGTVAPVKATLSGTELPNAYLGHIDLRSGSLTSAGWTAATGMNKARSKHSLIAAGGALFATSGIYSGLPGSSENSYAAINADGTIGSWLGATGSNTIQNVLGYSLYNESAVTFVDNTGRGHVLVLGGAKRSAEGRASAAVAYY